MRKLLLFFAMLCVSIGAWADATFSQIASSSNPVSNGKGFTFNHTTYAVTLENAGDLASYEYVAAGAEAGADDVQYGTYFTFSGPMNAADLQALSTFASDANVTHDVYFDFSAATFVDDKGNTLTDASIISSMNNSKVKYIVLPDNTNDISDVTFPSNVQEALAVNETGHKFLAYATYDGSATGGAGTLEHLIAFDNRTSSNSAITDFVFTGTYWHQNTTFDTTGEYHDVFSLIYSSYGYANCPLTNLDLTNATFPAYGEPKERVNTLFTDTKNTEDYNAMVSINLFNAKLESVNLPTTSGTTIIPFKAFYNCTHLTSVEVPSNITFLGSYAFQSCQGITELTFNKGLQSMGFDSFEYCTELTSITLPVGLENIGEYAFINCNKVTSIVIPEGVKKLGEGCFEYTNIETVRLPNSLQIIEDNAFRQCLSLKTITIPENVETIGSKAFYGCHSLIDVYVLGTEVIPACPADAFDGDAYRYHDTCKEVSKNTEPSHAYGYAGYPGNTSGDRVFSANASKVNASSWGIGEEKGAVVLHYPVVNTEAGYAPTDYATAYADYTTAKAAYDAFKAEHESEITAYEEALAAYNAAKEGVIYKDGKWMKQNGTEPNATKIWAYETNEGYTYHDSNVYNYYYKDASGKYVEISISDVWNYNENLYAAKKGDVVPKYVEVDDETAAILDAGEPTSVEGMPAVPVAPSALVKSGDSYVEYSGAPVEGVTYYVATEAGNDIYGNYYTDLERNSRYGGVYAPAEGEDDHGISLWPDGNDLYAYPAANSTNDGVTYPAIDGKDYSGWKNFLLVAGFPAESTTSQVQEIDHIKKDVWYTMCFPFDLTDVQLTACFGAGYEVAQFASVVENDSKTGYVLNFTTSVTPDANGVVTHKHIPYMIHPNSMNVNEDGTPKETVFTLSGIKETQEDHDADQSVMMANKVAVEGYGGTFTFVGYGHNYQPSSVLIPRYSFFLGTKAGDTYPKYWRQTGEDTRASGGYWNKNIAIVLPPSFEWSEVDDRAIYSDTKDGDSYVLLSTVRNEDSEKYKNYICEEYMYTPSSSAGAKALTNFEIMFTDDPIEDKESMGGTTAIKDVEEVVKSTVANGKVFSINGQYMGNSLENLPKGIYILNGKKYVIK